MKRNIVLCSGLVAVTTAMAAMASQYAGASSQQIAFSEDMTLKQLAKRNGLPLKKILHIMSHKDHAVWELPKQKPIRSLAVDPVEVRAALEHIREESGAIWDSLRYIVWALLISAVVLFVLTRKKIRTVRSVIMLFSVGVFGVLLGASPNPMESVVKSLKMLNNMEAEPKVVVLSLIIFTIMSLAGSKLICSWGCQLGALQECLFNIPLFKRKSSFQVPFTISLVVRVVFFVVFLLMLFGIALGISNFVIYHHVNYFKVYRFHDMAKFALYTLPVLLVASLLIFRPFCQFICPFGLYAWLLENFAANRIRIDREECIECLECVKACPTEAMKGLHAEKRTYLLPDCWSCGKCIEACPTNAVLYGLKLKKKRD